MSIIDKFGELVKSRIVEHPGSANGLLYYGYYADYIKNKFTKGSQLPHRSYGAAVTNRVIRAGMKHSEMTALVNVFFPCEILHAMNILPQFVEGAASYLNGAKAEKGFIDFAEKSGIPKTHCSYHKTLLGAYKSKVFRSSAFVATTSMACDANTLTFRDVAESSGAPYFIIDVPKTESEESIQYVKSQLSDFIRFAELNTGVKFEMDALCGVMEREKVTLELFRKYYQLLADKFMPGDMTAEMYRIFFSHILMGTEESRRYFELLLTDIGLASNFAEMEKPIRLYWVHTMPFWQMSFRELFNGSERYQLVASDLNLDYLELPDLSDPLGSLAHKLLYNVMNGSAADRAKLAIKNCRDLHCDGAVIFNHWGCKKTIGGSVLMKNMLNEAGIPCLVLDGDGCDRANVNDGQMRTKMEAYLEMLKNV